MGTHRGLGGAEMDRYETIIGAVGVVLTALLLTFGNVLMEMLFRALGV